MQRPRPSSRAARASAGSAGASRALDAARLARTVIIGNAGAGKSWLAQRLTAACQSRAIDLDRLYRDCDPPEPNDRYGDAALRLLTDAAAAPRWIIEGIHAPFAARALSRATTLIWLDAPWSECLAGLNARGPWPGLDPANWPVYIRWAGNYWYRDDARSLAAHERLFAQFPGAKLRLEDRRAATAFAAGLKPSAPPAPAPA